MSQNALFFNKIFSFSKLEKSLSQYLSFLSTEELLKANEFVFDKHRNKYITCRGTLRRELSQFLKCSPNDIIFSYNEFGKPRLVYPFDNSLYFNVSHSGDLFQIAIAEQEIGVDIEQINKNIDVFGVGKEVFTVNELAQLHSCSEDERYGQFYKMWTIKEAYIKYIGKGFSFDPKDIEICDESQSFRNPKSPHPTQKFPNFTQSFLGSEYSTAIVDIR